MLKIFIGSGRAWDYENCERKSDVILNFKHSDWLKNLCIRLAPGFNVKSKFQHRMATLFCNEVLRFDLNVTWLVSAPIRLLYFRGQSQCNICLWLQLQNWILYIIFNKSLCIVADWLLIFKPIRKLKKNSVKIYS